MKPGWILCGFAILLANTAVQAAEAVVWFVDGRTLAVESLSFEGDVATLVFAEGSHLMVPAARIERFQPAAPSVAVAAPVAHPVVEAWHSLAGPYAETIRRAAHRHGVDPVLLAAMAEVESGFDPQAISHKGAQGLLQLMPATARRFGVTNSFDPEQNVDGGARYLDWLLTRFSGDEQLALAGYNAGEGAVDRYQGIPPFQETERYVVRVLNRVEILRSGSTNAH
jgi:soluble lytic murein transglycosylase-like protein